ncbi:hypothetical protein J2X14_002994 [Pantoea alhagi]|uniref:hypothetical protein n=1 Tax=Mixta sp. BE291 TaxID=3158787 RepID=UPI00285C1A87|nr:hypothetical protein [Pantoea alhagi]
MKTFPCCHPDKHAFMAVLHRLSWPTRNPFWLSFSILEVSRYSSPGIFSFILKLSFHAFPVRQIILMNAFPDVIHSTDSLSDAVQFALVSKGNKLPFPLTMDLGKNLKRRIALSL